MRREFVYFMRNTENGLIKIGQSHHPSVRLHQIEDQVGARLELLATIPQPVPIEKLLHFKFAHLQDHGEWFNPGDDLLEMIAVYGDRPDLVGGGDSMTVIQNEFLNERVGILEQMKDIYEGIVNNQDLIIAKWKGRAFYAGFGFAVFFLGNAAMSVAALLSRH